MWINLNRVKFDVAVVSDRGEIVGRIKTADKKPTQEEKSRNPLGNILPNLYPEEKVEGDKDGEV